MLLVEPAVESGQVLVSAVGEHAVGDEEVSQVVDGGRLGECIEGGVLEVSLYEPGWLLT